MNHPRFLATIYKIWMLRYVDVPEDIGLALAKEYAAATKPSKRKRGNSKSLPKHIPVVATSNNRSTRTTLVPAGAGRYRLQVNATLRIAARADVGEVIGISLKIDLATRELPVPEELEAALKSRPRLKKRIRSPHRRWAHAICPLVLREIPRSPKEAPNARSRSPHRPRSHPQNKIPR